VAEKCAEVLEQYRIEEKEKERSDFIEINSKCPTTSNKQISF
jgi:hypothetical protein